jgi:hypothetical protein
MVRSGRAGRCDRCHISPDGRSSVRASPAPDHQDEIANAQAAARTFAASGGRSRSKASIAGSGLRRRRARRPSLAATRRRRRRRRERSPQPRAGRRTRTSGASGPIQPEALRVGRDGRPRLDWQVLGHGLGAHQLSRRSLTRRRPTSAWRPYEAAVAARCNRGRSPFADAPTGASLSESWSCSSRRRVLSSAGENARIRTPRLGLSQRFV